MPQPDPHNVNEAASDEELATAYNREHNLTYEQKWAALSIDDSPLVREALVRADTLRGHQIDPGDAYLQGFIDMHYYKSRQVLAQQIAEGLQAPLVSPEAVDPPA